MSINTQLPSYSNLVAEEMAANIGLNVKHIPILVMSFTEESVGILEKMKTSIAKNDYDGISNAAHSIKGSAGNLKFIEMFELAKVMELSAKDSNTDFPYLEACESLEKAVQSIKVSN